MYCYMLLLVLIPVILTDKVDIGIILKTDSITPNLKSDVISYSANINTKFKLDDTKNYIEVTDEDITTIDNAFKKLFENKVSYIYCYLPNINPDELDTIAANYTIPTINIATSPHISCLKHVAYGFDSCYSKFMAIDSLKSRNRYNIIIGEENECSLGLIEFLSQFATPTNLSFTSTTPNMADIEKHLEKIYNDIGTTAVYIYNFLPDFISDIQTAITTKGVKGTLISFDVDREQIYSNEANYVGQLMVGEFFDFNNSDPNIISKFSPASTPYIFHTVELWLFYMLELYSTVLMRTTVTSQTIINFEIYDVEMTISDYAFSLLHNNHLMSNIDIVMIRSPKPTMKIATVELQFQVPIAQIVGFPSNITCNVLNTPSIEGVDALFVGISFSGSGDSGYLASHVLVSLLTGIDYVNRNEPLMGKQLVPIFINADLPDEEYVAKYYKQSSMFKILCVFADVDIEILDGFTKAYSDLNIIYIELGKVGGEFCNNRIMNGNLPTSLYLTRATISVFKDFERVFILSSNTLASKQAVEAMNYIANLQSISIIGSYEMVSADDIPAQNACTTIINNCESSLCLIINLADSDYHIPFFSNYYRKNMTSAIYPILVFNLDERLISLSKAEYFEGAYVMSYYFNSMKTEQSTQLSDALSKLYGRDPVITSNMAVAYSQVFLLKSAINVIYSTDINQLKSVMGYISYNGPGGIISWTSEGFASSTVELGVVKAGIIDKVDSGVFLDIAYSYLDLTKHCDWDSGNTVTNREVYKIIFLHVIDSYTKDYDQYYHQYFSLMVSLMNQNYGGINDRYLIGVKPYLYSIDDLVEFVRDHGKDDDIIAFLGTRTNKERESIQQYLLDYEKLLFVVFPYEGEYSNANVINVGYTPSNYVDVVIGYHYQKTKKFVIIYDPTDSYFIIYYLLYCSPNLVIINTMEKSFNRSRAKYEEISYKKNDDIKPIVDYLKANYTEGVAIFTLIHKNVEILLKKMYDQGLSSDTYPVTMLDILFAFVADASDSSIYEGHYFIGSYTYKEEDDQNTIMIDFLRSSYGEPKILATQESMNIYAVLRFLYTAVESINSIETKSLKDEIYRTTLNLPQGKISISSTNMAMSGMHLFQCDGANDYDVILESPGLSDSFPLSRNDDTVLSIQYTYDYTLSNEKRVADVYAIGLLIDKNYDENYFLLSRFVEKMNGEGGNNGRKYMLFQMYCDIFEELQVFIERSDVEVLISNCNSQLFSAFDGALGRNGLVAFSLNNEDSNFCLNHTYFTGSSPSQRTMSLLQYTFTHYSSNFLILLPTSMKNKAEYSILMDIIDSYDGVKYVYFINETESSDIEVPIVRDIVSSVKLYFPTEAVILNYLNSNEELNTEIYKSLFRLLSPMYNHCETSKSFSEDYVIISTNIDLFITVPYEYREGHLCRIYAYSDENNSPEIYEIGEDTYGDVILNELEFNFLATFDLLVSALAGRNSAVSLTNTLQGKTFSTSYGNIKVGVDNYIQFPMYLLTSEGENIIVKDKLYDEYPSDTFRKYFNAYEDYKVCSYGYSLSYTPSVLMLLLPLSGEYTTIGTDMLITYSVVIDYLNNNNTNSMRFYSPIICNVDSDSNLAIKCIKEMVKKYNTRVAFGIFSSEMRIAISNTLDEEEVLLYYPHEYEGFECNHHIIYTGIPYSVYTAFVPFLTSTLSEQMFFLYTSSIRNKVIYEYVVKEVSERGFDASLFLEVQTDGYNITNILNYVTNKMKSGVIVSLLVAKTSEEFLLEFCKQGYTSDDYKIVNMFLYGKDVKNNYRCSNGHYFWEGMYDINEEINNVNSNYSIIMGKKYTQYSESTTLIAGSVLSVLLNHYAFNEMKYIPSKEYPDNYTFEELTEAVYNSKIPEFPKIKVTSSNHLSSSLSLNQVVYNSTTDEYSEIKVYSMINEKPSNPYGLEFLVDSGNHYYVCNWSKYNTSKYEEDVLLVSLCLSVSGSLKEIEYQGIDPVVSVIYNINNNGGIHGRFLIYRIYDTQSDKTVAVEVLKRVIEDNAAIIIGGYSSDIFYVMSNYLLPYNKTIWFPGAFEGQECRRNAYYTGPVSNQFTDAIINYLTKNSKIEKNVMLLGDNRVWANTIFTIIQNKIKANGYNIYLYALQEFSDVEMAVKEGLAKMKNGGTIITSYASSDFIKIINYMEQNITVHGIYELIAVSGDRDIINRLSVTGKFDVILTASHFDENPVAYPELEEELFQYTSTTQLSMFGESCAAALLLWSSALYKSPEILLDYDLNPYLYGTTINLCDGPIKMNTNHYTSLYVSLGKMIPNQHSVEMVMVQKTAQSPMAWSWEIPETYGKVCDYNSSIGEIGELNAITILLCISQSGVRTDFDNGIKSIIELIVMNVNNEGGVLGKQLYLSTMDITSNDVECSALIKEQLIATKYDVLFTTASSICLEAITSITQELDVTIVSLGYNGGESCVKNIIYASRETSTIDRLINVHLRTNKDNTMIYSVIYTTETSSIAMYEYTEKFIKFKEIKIAYSISIAADYTDFDNILNSVISNCPDGCTILFFGTNINHIGMDKYYREKSMTIDKYPILSYTTSEIMIGTNVSPFYSGQSYFTSITNENSKQFIDSVKIYTDEQITEVMENTYSILNMWIEAVKNIRMTNSSKVISQMYNVDYYSPGGLISLKTNNYLSHFFYIGKLSEDSSKFEIKYSASKAITPIAWKTLINSGSYTCDFSQESVGYYQKDMSCTVGILNSYSGKFMTTERAMTDGIVQAINEINESGGVLQRKILMETRDPESNDNKYMDYAKELGKLDEVKAVFGTGRYAVEKLLAPIFDKYGKPFFYPGNSAGEFCSAYVFSLQSTTNQLTHGLEKFEFSQWNEYVVVQVPTNPYSTISTRSILTRLNIFQSVVHGPYNTTDFSQMDELSDEVLKRSNIVLSVGADGIPPSLSYFCDTRKLNARSIHIVVTTLDQRILDQLDQDCVEGLYFLSTFMTEMGISTSAKGTFIESAESFVTNMQNSYGADVQLSAAMEAGYTAVKLWADVVENTYSFDIEKARQRMYGYLYRSATGDLEMNVNGFASRVIYYGVVIQNKNINILNYAKTPEEALAYDNYLPENVGYTCDWTDKGDKYKLESIKVIFLHEANKQESEIPIMLEEAAMIKEINYNKINGYNIISEFVFGNSSEDFDYKLSQYDEDKEVVVYIGCRSVECREMAIKHSSKTGKLFYNLGITEGNYCYGNVINIGTTAYQRISLILNYAYTQSINLFYLVGDDSEVDKIDYDVANHYLKQNQTQNLRSYFITDKVITKNIVTTIMDKITTYSESERVGIIFTLKGERARTFLKYVVDNNYLAREIVFLFVEYHYHDYHTFDLSKFSGSYVSVSFHPVLKAALPQSYISDTQNNIGINTNITEEVEGVKIVLDLWQETMISSSSDSGNSLPSIDYMMVNTVGISRSVPSGTASIEDNSYSVRSIYVLEITTNGDLNQIEPYRDSATIDVNPNPYFISSVPSECKLGKRNVNFTYDNVLEIIFWLLLALACSGGLFCFIFTIGNQNKLIIRSFGRFYNYVLSFLLMVTPLSAIPIAIAPTEHNGICMARPLILGLCTKMILMTMISKASKLYKKLKVTRTAIVTKTHISPARVITCLLIAVILEIILHLLWRYIDPNEFMSVYSQKYSSYFEEIYIRECSVSTSFTVIELIIDGLMCLVLMFYSYAARNIANEFNDSLSLFLSSIITTILCAVLVALDFNIYNEPDSVLIFRGIGIQINVIILCILQFGFNLYINENAGRNTSSGSAMDGKNKTVMSTTSHGYSQSLLKSSTMSMTMSHGRFTTNTLKTMTTHQKN